MDRRDLGFLLMAALTTVLVVAIRWIVHRYDISRIAAKQNDAALQNLIDRHKSK